MMRTCVECLEPLEQEATGAVCAPCLEHLANEDALRQDEQRCADACVDLEDDDA